MGDLGTPFMLLPKGGDPHDFQLKPSQAQALSDADLIFWDGPELMPAPGRCHCKPWSQMPNPCHCCTQAAAKSECLTATKALTRTLGWTQPMQMPGLAPSPPNCLRLDPENAATYAANAATAQGDIRHLDADLTAQLGAA